MQSYADRCDQRRRRDSPSRSNFPISQATTRYHNEIPFRASSLPLFARSRIKSPQPPITPPRPRSQPTFAPRSTPLTPRRDRPRTLPVTPNLELEQDYEHNSMDQLPTPPPTPIPFSRFSALPSTPGMSVGPSTCGSTPNRAMSRPLTPVTPTHIRYDDRGLPVDRFPLDIEWSNVDDTASTYRPWLEAMSFPEDRKALILKLPRTPASLTRAPSAEIVYLPISTPRESFHTTLSNHIRTEPKMLHHVSSDGGPLAALRRYIDTSSGDSKIAGMSLFLHCPKKRVPLYSEKRRREERKIAIEWNRLLRLSGESFDAVIR
jgi:hypothetical protein